MYWLGIDIGSISTDLVLINEKGEAEKSLYLKTGGKPAEAVRSGLNMLGKEVKDEEVAAVGVTGSGRALGSAIAGGDVVKNEITAHACAAGRIDPEIRTVIEIGGQDSKIIIMDDGYVTDFAMNTVCAAGTGSFLDRQASRLGITVQELGDMAAEAKNSVSIAGRCAVFAESDIIHKQQTGASEKEIMAGVCRALAESYLTNVARGMKIEPKICFQGGVASNKGMRKAFEELLECEILVPEEHKIMGAMGAALLALEKNIDSTEFKGFNAAEGKLETNEMKCSGCSNRCSVTSVKSGDRSLGCFGDVCGKYSGNIFS